MKRFLNFFKRPVAEQLLLAESMALVFSIGLILRIVPFRFLKKALTSRLSAQVEQKPPDWEKINTIIRAVRSVSRYLPFATCLPQALTALLLINSKGQHSELKIGVAKGADNDFKAHAWLETNGRIIIGKLPSHWQYKVLDTLFR